MLTLREIRPILISEYQGEGRREPRTRNIPILAQLTDLYVDRISVVVVNVTRGGIGLKVEHRLRIDFPVLIECDGLVITGNVRHCVKASSGGYVIGLKIHRIIDTLASEKAGDGADVSQAGIARVPYTERAGTV